MEISDDGEAPLPLWRPPPNTLPAGAWFGMTTRLGGQSKGPYASFNVSLGVGDDPEAVRWNRERLRAALGYPMPTPPLLSQVHGAAIVRPEKAGVEADGFAVRRGDPWVAVSAADCAPVAVVSEDGSLGAILHAGWRGARSGIAARAVQRLAAEGADPSRLFAVVGPCLHACCFPVGPEVAVEFDPSVRRPHPSGQEAIDLPGAIRLSLVHSGVDARRIHLAPECTSSDSDRFYSYRRDKAITGRHWAFLRLS